MFHRCSGVRVPAKPGIGVPAMPTDVMRYIVAGETSCIVAFSPIAGGFGVSARPAGPSPRPEMP